MKKRIAVLGGGAASLSAITELTRRPGWKERFDITVFQMGHRLGGKGASGVNRADHDRIEEHGLHIFWGFYENAFRTLGEVYAELGRPPGAPLATVEQAFFPQDLIVVPEHQPDGSWDFWPWKMARNDRRPGDGLDDVLEPWDYIPRLASRGLDALGLGLKPASNELLSRIRPWLQRALDSGFEGFAVLDRVFGGLARTFLETVVKGERLSRALLPLAGGLATVRALSAAMDLPRSERYRSISFLARHLTASFDQLIARGETDHRLRVQIDLLLTLLRGLVVDKLVLPPRDFHSADDESLRGWLERHGAKRETLDSALLEGLHAAIYSTGLDVAAGTGVHGLLRIACTYKGAVLWKMRAGMGETIFAPWYEVLRRRGVKFEFFHAVSRLELSNDKRRIAKVHLDVQAAPREGWAPLVEVKGLPVWPSEPDWAQLVDGEALRARGADFENWWSAVPPLSQRVLVDGADFDEVLLGISVGALSDVARELCDDVENPRFGAMVKHVKTTLTQSATVWMTPTLEQLGWRSDEPPVVIPFAAPMDTWADMAHLLDREAWAPTKRPGSVAYLTARLADDEVAPPRGPSDYPQRLHARIKASTRGWLEQSAGALWKGASSTNLPGEVLWHWLVDDRERDGAARLDAQWVAPVMNPSNRYVLTMPGTTKYRLRPFESGYTNLTLAGDWVRNAINGGCFEAAVLSGLDAARSLDPAVRPGIGDWLGHFERSTRAAPEPAAGALPPLPAPPQPPVPELPVRARGLPALVPVDGALIASPPIDLQTDVTMAVVRADATALQALLDAHLNHGPGEQRYRAFAPWVVFYFARIDNHAAVDPLGYVPELDFGVWVPAVAGVERQGVFTADRVVSFTPYLWVDSDVALVNGRAVFGYAKELGWNMTAPTRDAPETPWAVDVSVLPTAGPGRPVTRTRLLTARRTTAAMRPVSSMAQLLSALLDTLGAQGSVVSGLGAAGLLLDAAPKGQRQVFLKQVPDAVDPRRACYQAVVEAEVAFTGPVSLERLEAPLELELRPAASHRVARTLGLEVSERRGDVEVLRSIAAVRAQFSARLGVAELVWERGLEGVSRERRR